MKIPTIITGQAKVRSVRVDQSNSKPSDSKKIIDMMYEKCKSTTLTQNMKYDELLRIVVDNYSTLIDSRVSTSIDYFIPDSFPNAILEAIFILTIIGKSCNNDPKTITSIDDAIENTIMDINKQHKSNYRIESFMSYESGEINIGVMLKKYTETDNYEKLNLDFFTYRSGKTGIVILTNKFSNKVP